jgi:hypothetical protein
MLALHTVPGIRTDERLDSQKRHPGTTRLDTRLVALTNWRDRNREMAVALKLDVGEAMSL